MIIMCLHLCKRVVYLYDYHVFTFVLDSSVFTCFENIIGKLPNCTHYFYLLMLYYNMLASSSLLLKKYYY